MRGCSKRNDYTLIVSPPQSGIGQLAGVAVPGQSAQRRHTKSGRVAANVRSGSVADVAQFAQFVRCLPIADLKRKDLLVLT